MGRRFPAGAAEYRGQQQRARIIYLYGINTAQIAGTAARPELDLTSPISCWDCRSRLLCSLAQDNYHFRGHYWDLYAAG